MLKTPIAIVVLYGVIIKYGLSVTYYEYDPDPRVEQWLLLGRWAYICLVLGAYILIVLIGPQLMQNRKPFTLRTPLKCYNLVQVFLCGYIFKELLFSAIEAQYNIKCQGVDYSNSPAALRMAAAVWWYFISKIVDTFDTIFFILRKKNSHVSFLHVYHHASMIFNLWLVVKYTPGGTVFSQCMLNSLVHVVMYTYYFLSAFGPKFQKYLWWKKYLTQLQLVQFGIMIMHMIVGMFNPCEFPYIFNTYLIVYSIVFFTLFLNFYFETYSHKQRDRLATAPKPQELKSTIIQKKGMPIVDRRPILCGNDFFRCCRH